ncbi:putative aspartyl-tRNA amidotransferase [Erwinia phage pEa_SNUABM_50]|uniref:Putative aspartyl-tRNA amidotransferase n=1 Tax=Erwinia phage pEa_SNUABM_50 TaxID=2768775 RepID=A0A7L8ZQG9_9CAUD|nr:putative aspartyl-tRNA amidotransferase [Erwinia phage pEa_SNUABM_50]QXO11337.1 hypothetical protein pEaSNUABM19_00191 [Erwinia phage pEa_SNUABM_19]
MSLLTTIQTERQAALGKDKVKYSLFGVIIAEVQRKTTASDVDDSVVLQSVKKLLESVNDTLKYSSTEVLEAEKVLLENLLPKQLSNDELLAIMQEAISKDSSMKEKKNMFPYLKANYDGQYNGKDANILFGQLGA